MSLIVSGFPDKIYDNPPHPHPRNIQFDIRLRYDTSKTILLSKSILTVYIHIFKKEVLMSVLSIDYLLKFRFITVAAKILND